MLKRVYDYYYGYKSYTLNYCFEKSMESFKRAVQRGQRSDATISIYQSNWKRFFEKYPIAERPIEKIKASELHEHLEQIVFDLDLSNQGMNDAKTLVNRAWAWACNNDVTQINVAENISTLDIVCRIVENDDLVYTDEERDKLLKVMEECDHVTAKALSLMFCLCVRSGEIRALKWEDVDFDNRTIHIHAQIVLGRENGKRKDVYRGRTKNKAIEGNRLALLSDRALEILKGQKRANPFGEFVFEYGGNFLKPNMLNNHLRKFCEKANVGYMPTHKIRFWSVTAMNNMDVPEATMQYMAGHKDSMTTNRYKRVGRLRGINLETTNAIYG